MQDILKQYKVESIIPKETVQNYTNKIPKQVLNIWEKDGAGTILNGYLKIINPDDLTELMQEVYTRSQDAIPLFVTSMGDIIVWEKNRYLNLLNFRKNKVDVISAGFDFFLEDLGDTEFLDEELDWQPYPLAVREYGEPTFDECFGYVPILGLGGPEKVENLKKVKWMEHIYLITQFMGPLE